LKKICTQQLTKNKRGQDFDLNTQIKTAGKTGPLPSKNLLAQAYFRNPSRARKGKHTGSRYLEQNQEFPGVLASSRSTSRVVAERQTESSIPVDDELHRTTFG
jgi:hypothetical protein